MSAHSQLKLFYEGDLFFWRKTLARVPFLRTSQLKNALKIWKNLPERHGLTVDDSVWAKSAKDFNLAFLDALAKKYDAEVAGSKLMLGVTALREQIEAFDRAKFIIIVRTPRRIILSRLRMERRRYGRKARLARLEVFFHRMLAFYDQVERMERAGCFATRRFLLCHYESLLEDSQTVFDDIFSFLSLESEKVENRAFHEGMAEGDHLENVRRKAITPTRADDSGHDSEVESRIDSFCALLNERFSHCAFWQDYLEPHDLEANGECTEPRKLDSSRVRLLTDFVKHEQMKMIAMAFVPHGLWQLYRNRSGAEPPSD